MAGPPDGAPSGKAYGADLQPLKVAGFDAPIGGRFSAPADTHYEGRRYVGLARHLILALIVIAFVSIHTGRLRGEKPAGDDGAGVPGDQREVRDALSPSPGESCHAGAVIRDHQRRNEQAAGPTGSSGIDASSKPAL